jgi:hypothetical protein
MFRHSQPLLYNKRGPTCRIFTFPSLVAQRFHSRKPFLPHGEYLFVDNGYTASFFRYWYKPQIRELLMTVFGIEIGLAVQAPGATADNARFMNGVYLNLVTV